MPAFLVRVENQHSEKIIFGEIKPGQIIAVDVAGEGEDATFTFTGNTKPRIPDALPTASQPGNHG